MSYRITEPHPSLPRTRYLLSGRGGAGNFTHITDPSTLTDPLNACGPASRTALSRSPFSSSSPSSAPTSSSHAPVYAHSGRGGSGNAYRPSERAMFSFDEELAQQRRLMEHAAPVYYVGRGGAGNAVEEMGKLGKRTSSMGSDRSSVSSSGGGGIGGDREELQRQHHQQQLQSQHQQQRRSLESAWHRVSRTFSRS